MSQQAHAELISAYLDGELQPEEAARLEHMAATDAAFRRQLEGMRGVVSNLQHLQRMAPPPTLGQDVARRIALAGEQRSLLDKVEDGMSRINGQSSIFSLFAVVLALAMILFFFAWGFENQQLVPVLLDEPAPESTAGSEANPDPATFQSRHIIVLGQHFERFDGGLWRQASIADDARTTIIEIDSDAGRQLLERHPELISLSGFARVQVEVDGEVLELRGVTPVVE